MKGVSSPYFDPEFDTLIERINPPGVVIDNETCEDCTLVKVDSANRHGILLEMVQVLTDLDLVISKSYISSDGGWLMDVFHVTDQLGNKMTDRSLIQFIRQSLAAGRKEGSPRQVRTCLGRLVGPAHEEASESTVVEVTATDRPGLLSEIAAVLAVLGCYVASVQAWTHNSRSAVILHVTDESTGEPITDPVRLADIEEQVDSVVEARVSMPGERRRVSVSGPKPGRVHTERRLHQMMTEDRDYEVGPAPPPAEADQFAVACLEAKRRINGSRGSGPSIPGMETRVSIDSWKERGYSVVNIRSRDRPKLLFDTVCALTDMQYVVFHASVSSHGPLAVQEYYIRNKAGCALDEHGERQRVTRCLVAAVERRVSHGLRLDLCTRNRTCLLADVTRILRENGLSLARAECSTRGERAVGTFYVTDISGGEVDPKAVEVAREEIGGGGVLEVSEDFAPGWPQVKKMMSSSPSIVMGDGSSSRSMEQDRPKFSLGSLLWSQIGRFSGNFGSSIRSGI